MSVFGPLCILLLKQANEEPVAPHPTQATADGQPTQDYTIYLELAKMINAAEGKGGEGW